MLCKTSAFNRKRTLSKVDCFLLTLFQGGWFCHPLIAFVFLSFRHLFSFFFGGMQPVGGWWVYVVSIGMPSFWLASLGQFVSAFRSLIILFSIPVGEEFLMWLPPLALRMFGQNVPRRKRWITAPHQECESLKRS